MARAAGYGVAEPGIGDGSVTAVCRAVAVRRWVAPCRWSQALEAGFRYTVTAADIAASIAGRLPVLATPRNVPPEGAGPFMEQMLPRTSGGPRADLRGIGRGRPGPNRRARLAEYADLGVDRVVLQGVRGRHRPRPGGHPGRRLRRSRPAGVGCRPPWTVTPRRLMVPVSGPCPGRRWATPAPAGRRGPRRPRRTCSRMRRRGSGSPGGAHRCGRRRCRRGGRRRAPR